MQWPSTFIAATAVWLPGQTDIDAAVERGEYEAHQRARTHYLSVTDAGPLPPPEMAVRAARSALRRSGGAAEDVVLLLHASMHRQGPAGWTPAAYVKERAIGGVAPAVDIGQASNGGLVALELGAAYLGTQPAEATVIVTTADNFNAPGFLHRYLSDDVVLADGATAAVLHPTRGIARLLASHTVGFTELEAAYRPPGELALGGKVEDCDFVDLTARKMSFAAAFGRERMLDLIAGGAVAVTEVVCADSDTAVEDFDHVVVPHLGEEFVQWDFLQPLKILVERTTWHWGRTVAHLGPGDPFAGLNHLVESGTARPGQKVMLLSMGAGFHWTCAALEILQAPQWEE
ncbi:ketoacyl-ACP synthase III family protein [Allokutzneria sp. A3M-2-11 16]|uniref:ketoacyl-ACP synthase III family protein n=1 Tax=Allokutzneria sp. A3M-2-11 16 TaxID=2962043 RepID=UPI0020B66732|nr:ketoacyl-ACP synthase III family protein [Allokutzneria sp. A3M-2-11 16]MCP3801987.1 ketoacyl-ACP synthase III family protein [Allokutzneria sp. A3M-2-11 16]